LSSQTSFFHFTWIQRLIPTAGLLLSSFFFQFFVAGGFLVNKTAYLKKIPGFGSSGGSMGRPLATGCRQTAPLAVAIAPKPVDTN